MLHNLKALDEVAFLYLNAKHHPFFDVVMYWASNPYIWFPFYIFLCLVIYYQLRQAAYFYITVAGIMEVVSDQASNLIKIWVRRPRPSHVSSFAPYIHLSSAGPGGLYGFVSNHASNTFALAVFMVLTLPLHAPPEMGDDGVGFADFL